MRWPAGWIKQWPPPPPELRVPQARGGPRACTARGSPGGANAADTPRATRDAPPAPILREHREAPPRARPSGAQTSPLLFSLCPSMPIPDKEPRPLAYVVKATFSLLGGRKCAPCCCVHTAGWGETASRIPQPASRIPSRSQSLATNPHTSDRPAGRRARLQLQSTSDRAGSAGERGSPDRQGQHETNPSRKERQLPVRLQIQT